MPISFPERHYLTFDELIPRWKCEANDIRAVIVSGALVPSYFFCAIIGPGNWIEIEDSDYPGFLEFERCLADFPPHAVNGFLFLRSPSETGANDCMFHLMCDSATERPSIEGSSSSWYHIPNGGLGLADVESKGVFMMSEVLRFEERGEKAQAPKDELNASVRQTLLLMIYAMAKQKFQFDPTKKKSDTVPLIQSAIVQQTGHSRSDKPIKKYLDEAAALYWKPKS